MPPQLTEAWSIAYLQILIVLLIFAFGIPSIIFQVTLPEEIQRIVNRRMKRYFLYPFIITVMALLIFSLSFVWFLHPCTAAIPTWKHWVGSIIVSLSLVSLIIFWWSYLRKLSKKKIVNYLENKLVKRFRKDSVILISEMIDLITLGERSEPGYEKEIVLKAIDRLIENIQISKRYTGGELEDILRSVDKIITGKDKPGNENNFQLFVDIIENTVNRLSSKKLLIKGDERLVYIVLKEIGKKSVELEFSQVVLRIVPVASSNSDALFEIGLSAFTSGDYFTALAALSKLETLALEAAPKGSNEINDFFGLLAHFWTANKSSRRRAETFFNLYGDQFSPLDRCLDQAIEHHYNIARYDTADQLISMKEELKKTRKKGRA